MNRIKEVLEIKGVKQTWLAYKLNKSYNMVNSYVQNRRQPSLSILQKIASILEVDVKDLLLQDNQNKQQIKEEEKISRISDSKSEIKESKLSNTKTIKVPLLGNIACGAPLFAEENIEAEFSISEGILKTAYKYFLLRANGDSMNQAGINNGDLVLIRQQNTANNGDKVVALIDDEATIKEFQHTGDMIILIPRSDNKNHQPIVLTSDFRIQGVVEAVLPI